MGAPRQAWLLLGLGGLLSALLAPAAAVQESRLLAESALYNAAKDPFARLDSFASLSAAQQEHWAREGSGTLEDKLHVLEQPLEVSLSVEVKLVGFAADGHFGINLGEHDFAPYVDALKADIVAHVLGVEDHTLPIKTKFYYRFTQAAHHLAGTLQNAIHQAVDAAPHKPGADEATPVSIPYRVVDNLLAEDFRKGELAYTVYLLNPTAAARRYLYHDPAQSAGRGCPAPLWVGRERYLWVDLTAGPTTYGPHSSGDGIFLETSLPRPELARYHSGTLQYKSLVADMVALVRSASEHLISPPAAYPHLRLYDTITIQVVRIVDHPVAESDRDAEPEGLGLEALRRELAELKVGVQDIRVRVKTVSYAQCDFCVAAYMRSLSTHTSNVAHRPPVPAVAYPGNLTIDHPVSSYQARVHQFLDSKEMRAAMQQFAIPGLWEEAGLDPPPPELAPSGAHHKTLPVYLYDLASEDPLLFDRHHQVVAFPEMLLAVRTQAGESLLDYKCGSEVVRMTPHTVARPLMAGVLSALWGVAHTSHTWSEADQAPVKNHLWAVGLTPFGPLGASEALSFSQRDVALRNVVHAHINASLASARSLLRAFANYGRGDAPLDRAAAKALDARWNALQYKLGRAARNAAIHNFDASVYFALSATHDVGAISQLLHAAAADLRTSLRCFQEAPLLGPQWYAALGVSAVLVALLYVRSAGTFKPKKF